MRNRCMIVVCGLSWLMCGCTVGPNYHAPQTAVEPSFGPDSLHATITTGPTVLTTSAIADAGWWRALHDPLLDKLMEQTVGANLDVKLAQARVREARAELA